MVSKKGREAAAAANHGSEGPSAARTKNRGGLRRRGEQPARGVGSDHQDEPPDGSKSPNANTVKQAGASAANAADVPASRGAPVDRSGPAARGDPAELDGPAPLDAEIAMMRVLMRRVFEHAGDCQDVAEWSQLLGALGAAATRLATLLRTQKALAGGESAVAEALREALRGEGEERRGDTETR
jgi:hypothetical protein